MDRLADMITRLEDKIADQDKRISTLEKEVYLKAPTQRVTEDYGTDNYRESTTGGSKGSEEATKKVLALLDERGVDARCVDYWRSHPDFHGELLHSLEDEDLPPNREAGRDESPYWMSRLKRHIETRTTAGWRGYDAPPSKGKGKKGRSRSRSRGYRS